MLEGKQAHDGGIASCLMALQGNCYRDAKKHPRPFKPADFPVFACQVDGQRCPGGGMRLNNDTIGLLKPFFCKDPKRAAKTEERHDAARRAAHDMRARHVKR